MTPPAALHDPQKAPWVPPRGASQWGGRAGGRSPDGGPCETAFWAPSNLGTNRTAPPADGASEPGGRGEEERLGRGDGLPPLGRSLVPPEKWNSPEGAPLSSPEPEEEGRRRNEGERARGGGSAFLFPRGSQMSRPPALPVCPGASQPGRSSRGREDTPAWGPAAPRPPAAQEAPSPLLAPVPRPWGTSAPRLWGRTVPPGASSAGPPARRCLSP